MSKEKRLAELKATASTMKEIPLGLKISISRLQDELYPENDGDDCLACGS